jgi:hypothetical protein
MYRHRVEIYSLIPDPLLLRILSEINTHTNMTLICKFLIMISQLPGKIHCSKLHFGLRLIVGPANEVFASQSEPRGHQWKRARSGPLLVREGRHCYDRERTTYLPLNYSHIFSISTDHQPYYIFDVPILRLRKELK